MCCLPPEIKELSAMRIPMGVCGAVLASMGLAAVPAAAEGATAHAFAFEAITGEDLPLDAFKGKVLLVVNTASFCGFTRQYADLQELWERFRDRGLVVLGVPSDDFGGQEPGSEAEIKEFCEVNFEIDFPLTAKQRVRGSGAHPFYRWAADRLGPVGTPKWNFHKYLIDADGRLVDWFSTTTKPTSKKVVTAIEKHIAEAAGGS